MLAATLFFAWMFNLVRVRGLVTKFGE